VTLSISEKNKKISKTGKHYIAAAAFCLVFSVVYECFSHGVYSLSMICLCLYPFFLGVLPFVFLKADERISCPEQAAKNLWNSGVMTWTAGSLVRGIMEIYGTTTPFETVYTAAGILFLLSAVILQFGRKKKNFEK